MPDPSLTEPRFDRSDPSLKRYFRDFEKPVPMPKKEPPPHRPFSLPQDLTGLRNLITFFQPSLIILDPLEAVPGHRQHLLALAHLAEETNCAILLTRSLSPSQLPTDPLHAPGPLPPFLAPVRSRLLLMPHPTDERHALLLTVKHTLCAQPEALTYQVHVTEQDVPVIRQFVPYPASLLTRLPTTPLRSPQRQAVLRFLNASPTAHTYDEILAATCYDKDAGRKTLWRMQRAGEVVCVPGTRWLYTTANHPCLAPAPSEQPPVPKSRPRNDPTRNVKTVAPSHFVVLCRRTYHIQFFAERNVCDEGTTCQIRYGSDKLDGP